MEFFTPTSISELESNTARPAKFGLEHLFRRESLSEQFRYRFCQFCGSMLNDHTSPLRCLPFRCDWLLAIGRCERQKPDAVAEATALAEAGRCFLAAERTVRDSQASGSTGACEHLAAAVNSFSHAIKVHVETNKQPSLAASLCLELGNALVEFNRSSEAIFHFQRAAELNIQNPLSCLLSMGKVASCKLAIGSLDGALSVFTDMSSMAYRAAPVPLPAFDDIIRRCEINRLLLLLILQPSPWQRLRPEHAQLLDRYMTLTQSSVSGSGGEYSPTGQQSDSQRNVLDSNLFLSLQSLAMACNEEADQPTLFQIAMDLGSYLDAEQTSLLTLLIGK